MPEAALKKLESMLTHYRSLSDCMIEGWEFVEDLEDLKAKMASE